MLIRVGISCCISYSIVSYILYALVDQITSVGEERANFSAIVQPKILWFLFLLVLGMGCVILL